MHGRIAGFEAHPADAGAGVSSSAGGGLPMPVQGRLGVRRARPLIALTAVLLAAAMPVRISDAFPIVDSLSVLDLLLVVAAVTLYLDLAFRPIDVGYPPLFGILCAPLALSAVSIVWSQDRPETFRWTIIYAEGVIAYLFVVRELDGVSAARVMTFIKRFAYLLIIPGVLLLLHVPGFAPQEQDLSQTSGSYISYYTRLSHPVLGRSNNLATLLAFFAPVLLTWGHLRHDRRIARAGIVTLLAIFLTLSRGALLAFVIAGLLYLPFALQRRGRRRGGLGAKVAVTVAIGFLGIAVLYTVNPTTREFFAGRLTLANVTDRSHLISLSVDKIASRPVLGYGGGVTPDGDLFLAKDVHNTFLQQVVYFGLPLGVAISLALCAIAGFFLARRPAFMAGAIAYAVMVQLALFLFESSFEGTVLRVLFYLSVGLVTALLRSIEREASTPAPARL